MGARLCEGWGHQPQRVADPLTAHYLARPLFHALRLVPHPNTAALRRVSERANAAPQAARAGQFVRERVKLVFFVN